MIRHFPKHHRLCRGISLLELIYVLLVIGVVLGFAWIKIAAVYTNFDVTKAGRQLNQMVMAVRTLHTGDKISADENMDLLNLPPDMVGHFKGQTIVFNPWRGRIDMFPGNAIGYGLDKINDEFTLRYDGVPNSSCTDFVLQSAGQMRSQGLVAISIAPKASDAKEICFANDSVCLNTVNSLMESQIDNLCRQKSRMTVMFTFNSH